MDWVKAHHLEVWSGTRDSQGMLPEMVRRLISASTDKIAEIRFPSGDAVGLTGFDGFLHVGDIVHEYVPGGSSIWECGTGENAQKKATDDYRKRTKRPQGVDPSTTTFIVITSRVWNGKKAWCDRRRKKGVWRDVRAYDAVDLEAWLTGCFGVQIWLAERLRLMPEGVSSMEEVMNGWCSSTKPSIPQGVVLAGRQEQSKELLRIYDGEPQAVLVQAGSAAEALAFVAATIMSSPQHKERLLPRAVVVYDRASARQLSSHHGLIIALLDGGSDLSGRLIQNNNYVIIPLGNDAVDQHKTIKLPLAGRMEFATALREMVDSDRAAEQLAMECGRSATVLRRRRPISNIEIPEWATGDAARNAIPALLAGGWDDNYPGDKESLAVLAQKDSYALVEQQLHNLTVAKDPPLRRVGSVWKLSAPVDAFSLLIRHLTKADFDRYEAIAIRVLGEDDPSLDLPPEQRATAGMRGIALRHSHYLRAGIAHTALLIATLGATAEIKAIDNPQAYINALFDKLLPADARWQRWGSLRNYLTMLAEAAPDPFLEALDAQIEGHEQDLRNLFWAPQLFGAGSPHNGILWALEKLAWNPEYLVRVTLALAKLERIAPDSHQSNPPMGSLRGIFLCWYPNTNASLAQRLTAIDALLVHDEEIGWRLLSHLLPSSHSVGEFSSAPELREFGKGDREVVTHQIVYEGYREITARAITHVGIDLERWKVLMNALGELHPEDRAKARNLLCERKEAFGEQQTAIWLLIREFMSKHRAYADAAWALPETEIMPWQEALDTFKPTDPITAQRWLFDGYYPELPRKIDIEKIDQTIAAERQHALKDIITAMGNDGLLRLIDECKSPELVAIELPNAGMKEHDCLNIIKATSNGSANRQHFASVLSAVGVSMFGNDWRKSILTAIKEKQWDNETAALILSRWPDDEATWDAVESLGSEIDLRYWRTKPVFLLKGTTADRERAIKKLITVGRYTHAIRSLILDYNNVASSLLMALLEGTIDEINTKGAAVLDTNLNAHIDDLFGALYKDPGADETAIARLEYAYLPLLRHSRRTLGLHRLLAKDPAFFTDVLCHGFKATGATQEEQLTEQQAMQARHAWELLHSWDDPIPGTKNDGSIDETALQSWVEKAIDLVTTKDRKIVGKHYIGKILAHALPDTDGEWPHRAIRNIIEQQKDKDIEHGFENECFNKRGAHARDPKGGGRPERTLETQYRNWATAINKEYPRTAAVLNRIADNWQQNAIEQDQRSKKWELEE